MNTFGTIEAASFAQILDHHGQWNAGREALVCGKERLCWSDFADYSRRLATWLNKQGWGAGDTIGVVMTNSAEMVLVLAGILRAGCCSVPINLSVSEAAIDSQLKDAAVKTVFVTEDQAQRISGFSTITPTQLWAILHETPADVSSIKVQPDAPMNIIYSSGTTGQPKGIVHTFKGRKLWADMLIPALGYRAAPRSLMAIGLYSNISWVGILCTWILGGCLVVLEKFDSQQTLDLMHQEKITNSSMVPIMLEKILTLALQDGITAPPSLDAIMSCGSSLRSELKQVLMDYFGNQAIIELYGLTEGVITVLDPADSEGNIASVGKPLPGIQLELINDAGSLVSADERGYRTGEIISRSAILMPGYLNKPDATLDAMWTHPETGDKWLKTGDIGTIDAHGFLSIIDRKKDMILSGGQNIYPQDIESIAITHPMIADVAVIGLPSRKWGETPVAVIAPTDRLSLDKAAIIDWINHRLGRQQRIADLIEIDCIPRNPNGKILKRSLRDSYKDLTYD